MAKTVPAFPDPTENEALLPFSPRSQHAGMFGAGGGAKNLRIPDIGMFPPAADPFSTAALDPNTIANLLQTSPTLSPLAIGAWAQANGRNALPTGPDIQFSAPDGGTPRASAGASHYRVPPPEVIAAAQASQRSTGVPASVSIAQWIYESGWGRHMPKDSNNFFGIKEPDLKKPGVVQETKEADPRTGEMVKRTQRFRKFTSPEESWAAHARLLSADPRYAKAMLLTHDPDRFVDTIAGTYAPNNRKYAANIKDTMKRNHLYQYDILPPSQ